MLASIVAQYRAQLAVLTTSARCLKALQKSSHLPIVRKVVVTTSIQLLTSEGSVLETIQETTTSLIPGPSAIAEEVVTGKATPNV